MFTYVSVTFPWEDRVEQVNSMISEGSVFLVYICASAFLFDLSEGVSSFICTVGLWITRLAVFINVAISTYRAGVTVVLVVAEYYKQVNKRFKQAAIRTHVVLRRNAKSWF